MKRLAGIPYAAAGALARALTLVGLPGNSKIARSIRARRGIANRYAEWAARNRDPSRPLLWIHAPSVGEGLQALPVLQLFRARHPEAQVTYSFFSPSAEAFAETVGADFHDCLPFDNARDARDTLSALRPNALVFSKLDVWPVFVETAARMGVSLGMLSATLPASSLRRTRLARLALGDAYSLLDAVGAASDGDALRLIEAGVSPDRITVTGDTRYDQAWAKAEDDSSDRAALLAPLRSTRFTSTRFTLVAGSTWPSDEKELLPAWLAVKHRHPTVRLIIAPHELSESHLESIELWARLNGLRHARMGDVYVSNADVIVVARYGILGDLYSIADAAYVGGGFRRAGLHSLLEPAAFGAPVIIGPQHTDNRDAQLLVSAGGAIRCADSSAIESRITQWVESPEILSRARAAARETVRLGLGAAGQSVAIVERLMQRTRALKTS